MAVAVPAGSTHAAHRDRPQAPARIVADVRKQGHCYVEQELELGLARSPCRCEIATAASSAALNASMPYHAAHHDTRCRTCCRSCVPRPARSSAAFRPLPAPGLRMSSRNVYLCDGIRTPFGRYRGGLSGIRTDDLAALPVRHLLERHPSIDPGPSRRAARCANQAGEDNRNVARMQRCLPGCTVGPGVTVNRLCASGLEAVGQAARAIASGEADLLIAGGVESMSRAPYVLPSGAAFSREQTLEDTTLDGASSIRACGNCTGSTRCGRRPKPCARAGHFPCGQTPMRCGRSNALRTRSAARRFEQN